MARIIVDEKVCKGCGIVRARMSAENHRPGQDPLKRQGLPPRSAGRARKVRGLRLLRHHVP